MNVEARLRTDIIILRGDIKAGTCKRLKRRCLAFKIQTVAPFSLPAVDEDEGDEYANLRLALAGPRTMRFEVRWGVGGRETRSLCFMHSDALLTFPSRSTEELNNVPGCWLH